MVCLFIFYSDRLLFVLMSLRSIGGDEKFLLSKVINVLTNCQRMPIIIWKLSEMRIISKGRLQEFWSVQPLAQKPLTEWYSVTIKAKWGSYDDLRKIYSSADQAKVKSGNIVTIFNIGGNKYRLVVAIHYNTRTVYILSVMTHEEYGKDIWKDKF